MKKFNLLSLALVFLLSLLLSYACKEETSLIAPGKTSVSSEEPNWISLPLSANRLQKTFMVTQKITKRRGGTISLKKAYVGGPHGKVKVSVKMEFPPKSIDHDEKFTLTIDDETGMMSISPEMTFNKAVSLTIKLEGIDLSGLDEDQIGFVYLDADGNYIPADFNKLKIDIGKGKLGVIKVTTNEGSRYGFTK